MADVQFTDTGDACDRDDIAVSEAVAHMKDESAGAGGIRGDLDLVQPASLFGGGGSVGVGSGMEFDGLDSELTGGVDLFGIGIDEEADFDPGGEELVDRAADDIATADDIEAAFGGDFLPPLGNKRALFRPHLESDLCDLLGGGHFEVQLDLHSFPEESEVSILDVPAVFAEMDGDPIGTAEFGQCCCPDGVRLDSPTCLPDRGDVIDVDAKSRHGSPNE